VKVQVRPGHLVTYDVEALESLVYLESMREIYKALVTQARNPADGIPLTPAA
jgi:hypothetical protein